MSLLGTQVYANPSTPLWLGAGGNQTLNGSLFVNGLIRATGDVQSPTAFTIYDPSLNGVGRLTANYSGSVWIQSPSNIKFGQIGQGTTNTTLTVSTPGVNADLLTVGGTVDAQALKLANTGGAAVVGSATLASGIVTINTTASDVNAQIFVTRTGFNTSTALGELRVSSQNASNFTVVSATPSAPSTTETGDQSSFAWFILNGT